MRADNLRLVTGFLQLDNFMYSFSVSKSPSATSTSTITSTSTTTSQDSQPGTADGQRPRSSFMGLSTTVNTPESALIPTTYHQQDQLGLWSEIGPSQIAPPEALATHLAVTFDNDYPGRSASSLSLSNEPARSQRSTQPVDDVAPTIRKEPSPDSTDRLIVMSSDEKRPFHCGYKGCGRKYVHKAHLQTHFVTHTGDSKLRCYLGDCAGTVIYRDVRLLTQHTQVHHSFEKPFECNICKRRFRRPDRLKSHRERVHCPESEKKPPKPQRVSESSSAATATITAGISAITSRVSRPELAAGQHQQSSYIGISTTIDAPESMQTAAHQQQQDGLRLLAEVSTSQINPFEALATHQTVTFDDEAVTTGIARVPNLPSDQHQAGQSPDPTDTNKWIIVDKSQERPYSCGYPGCDMTYLRKEHLRRHLVKHTGTSKFKCSYPECVGNEYFSEAATLKRHISSKHSLDKPFLCDRCNKRYRRKDSLKRHSREHVHSPKKRSKKEQKLLKRKKK